MWFLKIGSGLVLLIILDCLNTTSGQLEDVVGTLEKQILDTILNDRYYDKNFRPGRTNITGPTLVMVSLEIDRIKNLNDLSMELDMSFTIKQEWIDERLRFSHLNANIPKIHAPYLGQQKIWIPDTYFPNQVNLDHQSSIGPNVHVQISSDGTVFHTRRLSGKFYCPLHLQEFPHDSQTCSLKITSYGYTADDIDFEWSKQQAVSIPSETTFLPKFNLQDFETLNCSTGEKSCLEVGLNFKRELSHYLLQIYIPSAMMIIISFLSFWLDPVRMATPRTLLCISVLVLAVLQISALNATLPPVSYTKGIDIWTGVTLTFLFLALAEFVFVGCVCRIRRRWRYSPSEDSASDNLELPTVLKQYNSRRGSWNNSSNSHNNGEGDCRDFQRDLVYNNCALNIDRTARFLFPAVFFCFLVVYWGVFIARWDLKWF